ncbi:MAG: FHA domain-containing protein [Lautropia sp.]|nr:FHA domain-containing protein [Lautropia sp.]
MSRDHQDAGRAIYGQLTLSAASCPLQTYWLTNARTTIGRRASSMLVLDDLTVSGEHALLIVGQTEVIIQDLGSRNGTLVNGSPVARAFLNDGDCIDIGVYRLVFQRLPSLDGVVSPFLGASIGTPGDGRGPLPNGLTVEGHFPAAHKDRGIASHPSSVGGQAADGPAAQERGHGRDPSSGPDSTSDGGVPFGQNLSSAQIGTPSTGACRLPLEPPQQDLGGMSRAAGFKPLPAMPPLPGSPAEQHGLAREGSEAPSIPGFPRLIDGSREVMGFVPGFGRVPRLPAAPLPASRVHPIPRQRPPLQVPENYRGVSLRFLGGHDAGRLLLIDRPIVSIRNGCGQVAVVSCRPTGFYLTHVEGQAYPLVNGESIGLAAHPLRHHDLIELSGTIIQFCQTQHDPGPADSSGPQADPPGGPHR